jgi:hypothetical protein
MEIISKATKVKVILACVGGISLLFYVTPMRQYLLQDLATRAFYIPIVVGGLWFGLWGGLRVSLLATLICIPHALLSFRYDQALFYE